MDQLVRNVHNNVVSTAKSIGLDEVPAINDQVVGEFYSRKREFTACYFASVEKRGL